MARYSLLYASITGQGVTIIVEVVSADNTNPHSLTDVAQATKLFLLYSGTEEALTLCLESQFNRIKVRRKS